MSDNQPVSPRGKKKKNERQRERKTTTKKYVMVERIHVSDKMAGSSGGTPKIGLGALAVTWMGFLVLWKLCEIVIHALSGVIKKSQSLECRPIITYN